MKPKVYIAVPVSKKTEEYIGEFCEIRKWESEEFIPYDALRNEIKDAEGVLLYGRRIDKKLLEHASDLKVVSNISVGYNNFDIEAMKERKVMGTNTPGVLDNTVADMVFGLVLACARRIPEMDQYVRQKKWTGGNDSHLFGIDVHHGTLGIIGMGRIGEKVARRGKLGFDMDVLYHNRSRKTDLEDSLGVKYAEMDELLEKSDFVVVMTPLTPETEKIIGKNELARMKKTAYLINASRGQTVDEEALIEALEKNVIAGAGLDVFVKEPISPDNPLLTMKNTVLLPHISSATEKTRLEMEMHAAMNLVKAVTGEEPPSLVRELKDIYSKA